MIEISEYINVEKRAEELGCNIPTEVTVLPINFETANSRDEFRYKIYSMFFTELLMINEINETPLEKEGEKRTVIFLCSLESNLPTLFFAAKFIAIIGSTILLNLISSYVYDKLPKNTKNYDAEFSIVTESKSGTYKEIHYKGSKEGLKDLKETIKSVYNEE